MRSSVPSPSASSPPTGGTAPATVRILAPATGRLSGLALLAGLAGGGLAWLSPAAGGGLSGAAVLLAGAAWLGTRRVAPAPVQAPAPIAAPVTAAEAIQATTTPAPQAQVPQAQAHQAQGESGLRAAFEAAADALLLVGADGRVLRANPAALALLGPAAAEGGIWNANAPCPVYDGIPAAVETRPLAHPQDTPDGGGTLVVVRPPPMAERLRVQQIETQDALAGLAGAMTHDMNNTLGAIAGYADFLVTDLPEGSPTNGYAARILLAVERSRLGLQRLVAATRADPAARRSERAAGILAATLSLIQAGPDRPAAAPLLRDEADPSAPLPDPLCDAGLLARTLSALAVGMVQAVPVPFSDFMAGNGEPPAASPPAPQVSLRAAAWCPAAGVDPACDPHFASPPGWRVRTPLMPRPGPHVVFELHLDGPPLADESLLTLIDPLMTARTRHRRTPVVTVPQGGPSPGGSKADDSFVPTDEVLLSTARRLDGGVSLRTHAQEGTVVRLYVPAATPAAAATEDAAPLIRVLVVEADDATGDRMQAGLERRGCEVSVCQGAGEALEIVADEPGFFHVVVIGPSVLAAAEAPDGPALAARLKSLWPALPCVLHDDGDGATGALGRGGRAAADLVLPVPVDLARLAQGVTGLVTGEANGEAGGGNGRG